MYDVTRSSRGGTPVPSTSRIFELLKAPLWLRMLANRPFRIDKNSFEEFDYCSVICYKELNFPVKFQ